MEWIKNLDIETIKDLLLVKYKLITILSCITLGLLILLVVLSNSFEASETSAKKEYTKYQSQLHASTVLQSENDKEPQTVVIPSETAVDTDKIDADTKAAETFFESIFNWETGDEFDAAKQIVINTFGENSELNKTFGENYRLDNGANFVDIAGVNMQMNSVKTYPSEITPDGNNSYVSFVKVTTKSTDEGSNAAVSYVISVTYTVDEDSNLTDCKVWLMPNR